MGQRSAHGRCDGRCVTADEIARELALRRSSPRRALRRGTSEAVAAAWVMLTVRSGQLQARKLNLAAAAGFSSLIGWVDTIAAVLQC